jgi:acetyl-CoA carboxylase carboxyltransferase component
VVSGVEAGTPLGAGASTALERSTTPERSPTKLTPLERIERLCDDGTVHVIRSRVTSRRLGEKSRPGDGVIGAAGRVGGRPIFAYAQDQRFVGGSLGEAHADTIVRVMRLAGDAGAPVVGFIESGGARMQEGVAGLAGYGRIFYENVALSGRVPQISVITGTSAGGGSYSPALTDFVVMTKSATMFLTGPKVVKEALGEEASAESLGGASVHERNGVCHFVAQDDADSVSRVREILDYLPSNASSPGPQRMVVEPPNPDPTSVVPTEHRQVYDVRDVIRALADGGEFLEPSARWARNVVTALCRLNGRTVGVLANQPKFLGGTLDSESASKAARFVRLCNAFGLPMVVLVDTPGFMPGSRQERGGVIRHGAKLLHAFAESRAPRLTVVLRKAFGGAYISMNARDLGADFTFAWPQAEIGVMAASQAVGIIHRRKLDELEQDADAERAQLATGYAEEHLRAGVAAHDGFIDEVIEPAETRTRLIWALDALASRRSGGGVKNIPL